MHCIGIINYISWTRFAADLLFCVVLRFDLDVSVLRATMSLLHTQPAQVLMGSEVLATSQSQLEQLLQLMVNILFHFIYIFLLWLTCNPGLSCDASITTLLNLLFIYSFTLVHFCEN